MKTSGLQASAESVERVLEVVRRELGKSASDTDWDSLVHHFASGARDTEHFARRLGEAQAGDSGDALVHTFILRQIEVTMAFIAKLGEQVTILHEQLGELQSEVEALQTELEDMKVRV